MALTAEEKAERIKKLKADVLKQNTDMYIVEEEEQYKKLKPEKLNTWFVDGNGVHLTVKNPVGEFTATISTKDHGIPDLPKAITPVFKMNVPKIPAEVYYKIQRFFVDVCDRVNNAEAFTQIYWDKEKEKYVIFVPKQTVGAASVHYDTSENLNSKFPDRYIFVMDIHSHNTMSAFFSGTDDHDETETRFYGVFGKIKDKEPEFESRFVVNESKPKVRPEDIFDFKPGDNAKGYDYPKKWMNQIINRNRTTTKTSTGSKTTYHGNYRGGSYNGGAYSPWGWGDAWDDIDFMNQLGDGFTTGPGGNYSGRSSYYPNRTVKTVTPTKTTSKLTYANWTSALPEYIQDFIKEYKLSKGIAIKVEEVPKSTPPLLPTGSTTNSGGGKQDSVDNTNELSESLHDLSYYDYKGPGEREGIIADICSAMNEEDIHTMVEVLSAMGQADAIMSALENEGQLCWIDEQTHLAGR